MVSATRSLGSNHVGIVYFVMLIGGIFVVCKVFNDNVQIICIIKAFNVSI